MRLRSDWRDGVVALSLAAIPSLWGGEHGGNTCFSKWLWQLLEDSSLLSTGRENAILRDEHRACNALQP